MPFTISHIAAVLPAHRPLRRWGLFSAAIIGSMIPDFGFILPVHVARQHTHGMLALLTFCLPMGLLAWWLFQLLIKPAWCVVLPGIWRFRLRAEHSASRIGDWRAWAGAAVAILLGALSHLVWDGFTHEDGRGVRMLPFLDDYGPALVDHPIQLFRWMQHGSSVVGLMIIVAATWRWTYGGNHLSISDTQLRKYHGSMPEFSPRERFAWQLAYVLVAALLVFGSVALERPPLLSWTSLGTTVTRLAIYGLCAAIISLVAVSAAIRLRLARRL